MKKEDLMTGDIVLTRGGAKYIVLKGTKHFGNKKDTLINLKEGGYLEINYYNDDLTFYEYESDFDIIKVCSNNYVGDNIRDHIINNKDTWTWEREKEVKEMTLAEISEALGYEVKVVKEEK